MENPLGHGELRSSKQKNKTINTGYFLQETVNILCSECVLS
jgi:hypothetical protein